MKNLSAKAQHALQILREELSSNEYVVLSPSETRDIAHSDDNTSQDFLDALDRAHYIATKEGDAYILIHVTDR
jgi:hypothetical protein